MTTKCLFYVQEVAKLVNDNERVTLNAKYDPNDPEVKSYSDATPQGTLEIVVSNPNLYGKFKPRQDYYLTLEERVTE